MGAAMSLIETIQNAALLGVAFLLLGLVVMLFRAPVPRHARLPFDELAAKHDAMIRAQDALCDELADEVHERLTDNRQILKELYRRPWSLEIVGLRAKVYQEIRDDEEVLRALGQFGHGKRVIPESYDWL